MQAGRATSGNDDGGDLEQVLSRVVQGLGFQVQGAGFWFGGLVRGSRFKVQGRSSLSWERHGLPPSAAGAILSRLGRSENVRRTQANGIMNPRCLLWSVLVPLQREVPSTGRRSAHLDQAGGRGAPWQRPHDDAGKNSAQIAALNSTWLDKTLSQSKKSR